MVFGWGNNGPTPAQRHMNEVLTNESLHVLSTFELNRIASLTYGDEVCEEIFEMLEQIQSKPMEYTPLTVQKSLVVTKHVLVYGSEKCVNSSICLQRSVEALLEFNTVLWAQKLQGAAAFMYKLKGGGVDQGYPVREAAKEVWPLLTDPNKLRDLRNSSADPNSLVPVGSQKVGFLSDDVRHYMLKKRIQEQHAMQVKSNLVKSEGGFGAGYASKDGKMVVGAAHGLEEMMKQAERTGKRFSDEGEITPYSMPTYADPSTMRKPGGGPRTTKQKQQQQKKEQQQKQQQQQQQQAPVGDLLDFSAGMASSSSQPAATGDLLGGFGGGGGSADLLGAGGGSADLLGTGGGSSDLLGTGLGTASSASADPFGGLLGTTASTPAPASDTINSLMDPTAASAASNTQSSSGLLPNMGMLSLSQTSTSSTAAAPPAHDPFSPAATQPTAAKEPEDDTVPSITITSPPMGDVSPVNNIMGNSSNDDDPFAALEVPAAKTASTILSAKEAENRLLGATSSTTSAPSISSQQTNNNSDAMGMSPSMGLGMTAAAPNSGGLGADLGLSMGMNPPDTTTTPSLGPGQATESYGLGGPPGADMAGLGMGSVNVVGGDLPGMGSIPSDPGSELPGMGAIPSSAVADPMIPSSDSMGAGSGIRVAQTVTNLDISSSYHNTDAPGGGDDDGFVMGGSFGAGLEPTAAAPAAPPPPPPPPM